MASTRHSIKDAAKTLARYNAEADPDIREIWLFPHETEIRLIEVDPGLPKSDEVVAYRFPPDPAEGIWFPSAIALIRPEEKCLPLPQDWGTWDSAIKLHPRKAH